MKTKKLFSCLLAGLLCCCLLLTGCSSKSDTMFSAMKKIYRISSCEFNTQADITFQMEGEEIPLSLTLDGMTDKDSMCADMTVGMGALSFTMDDFIRMTDGIIYINLSSLVSIPMVGDYLEETSDWVSIPATQMNDDTRSLYFDFYDVMIDALENSCRNQTISQENDTWTLEIPGEKLASFAQAVLEQINTNFSDWYDLYVELLEKSGSGEMLKDYAALSGEETEEDPVQTLKDGKEDALAEWEEMYPSLKESLAEMEEAISNGETTASASYLVSLTGKDGSRQASLVLDFNLTETETSEFITCSMNHEMKEISKVEVEAPAQDQVMSFEEFMEAYEESMSSYYDYDYDDDMDISYYETLSDEEYNAILSNLGENQIYLYNSIEEDLEPYVLTYDADLYSVEEPIGDYSLYLDITGTDSYVNVAYDSGVLTDDLTEYYLEEGQTTAELSTDIGTIIYSTASEADGWGYITTTFGMQLDDDSYLIGLLDMDSSTKQDVETCLKKLLKELKPYEGNDSTSL